MNTDVVLDGVELVKETDKAYLVTVDITYKKDKSERQLTDGKATAWFPKSRCSLTISRGFPGTLSVPEWIVEPKEKEIATAMGYAIVGIKVGAYDEEDEPGYPDEEYYH